MDEDRPGIQIHSTGTRIRQPVMLCVISAEIEGANGQRSVADGGAPSDDDGGPVQPWGVLAAAAAAVHVAAIVLEWPTGVAVTLVPVVAAVVVVVVANVCGQPETVW